jgi:cytidylate kinase
MSTAGSSPTIAAAPVIAIDGPAATGKGTVAKAVAQALGFNYLESGSLYRLVALCALRRGLALDDERALAAAAQGLDARFEGDVVSYEGADVTEILREEAVGAAASKIAVFPGVRGALVAGQRAFRRPPGLVAEGRDMGTVIFPDALLKAYVTASDEERARRRHKQLIEKGNSVTIESLLRDIRERDARDSSRTVAPLKPAVDAMLLDTTHMTIDEAIAQVLERYRALAARTRREGR